MQRNVSRVLFLYLIALPFASYATTGITYHGRILMPDGVTPVTDSSVQFKMQVLTPDGQACVMYEETQTKDLSSTSGAFAITIGDGSVTRSDSSGFSFSQIFANYGTFSFSSGCTSGAGTYTPALTDNRYFQVAFKTSSSSWESLPLQAINPAPMAIESRQVAGYPATSLFRVDNGTAPQTVSALTTTQAANLIALANGSSTQYVQTTSNGAALPTLASNPSSPTTGDVWYDSTNNVLKYYNGSAVQTLGSGGSGLTSVGLTMPGIFSVGGSPLTANGTLAVTASGTSGGIPYFASSSTMASSAALTQYGVVIGGGTSAPTTTAAGASGAILTGQGSANPSFVSMSGDATMTNAGVVSVASTGASGFYKNGGNSFSAAATLGTNDSNNLAFKTNGATAMTITTSGTVGIGISSPGATLDIAKSDTDTTTKVTNTGSTTGRFPGFQAVNYMGATGTGWPIVKYTNSRGNTTTTGALQSGDLLGSFEAWGGTNTTFGTGQGGQISFVATENFSATANGSAIAFKTTANTTTGVQERMRINNNGNVGIGTTSPAAKLDVNGEIKLANTSSTCNATNEGQQRYNSSIHSMEFCNGTAWVSMMNTVTRVMATEATTLTNATTNAYSTFGGLSQTITTNAQPIYVSAQANGCWSNTATGYISFQIQMDGGTLATSTVELTNTSDVISIPLQTVVTPSAGSHTFTLVWGWVGNGATYTCNWKSTSNLIIWQ